MIFFLTCTLLDVFFWVEKLWSALWDSGNDDTIYILFWNGLGNGLGIMEGTK